MTSEDDDMNIMQNKIKGINVNFHWEKMSFKNQYNPIILMKLF